MTFDDEFVIAWQKAKSLAEVTVVMGMSLAHASSKACQLRGSGVPLKRFARNKKNIDIARLKKLAKASR